MNGSEHFRAGERVLSDASFCVSPTDAAPMTRDGKRMDPTAHAALIGRAAAHFAAAGAYVAVHGPRDADELAAVRPTWAAVWLCREFCGKCEGPAETLARHGGHVRELLTVLKLDGSEVGPRADLPPPKPKKPPFWPPVHGDTWRDGHGDLWLCESKRGCEWLSDQYLVCLTRQGDDGAEHINNTLGPMTLEHRPCTVEALF